MRSGLAFLTCSKCALIVDPCSYSGPALCELADHALGVPGGQHLVRLSALRSAMIGRPMHRMLVITELFSDSEGLSDALVWLDWLVSHRALGMKVVVYTGITDPLLLRLVLDCCPSALVLRHEQLDVLEAALHSSTTSYYHTWLSPGSSVVLEHLPAVSLTPREAEWLLTQTDGLDLNSSAMRMRVSYKTAAALRYNIIHRLGDNAATFGRRLAAMREQTGAGLRGWQKTP
ncbi:hypothetical protein QMA77_19535 [Pantoea ananatis]|uniref:hypothetical protein n=1 Tax=Pantoea ananas TaxID=553 RepID=UPI0024AE39D3|nr:hypothetical protein [Pantoea ananatis]MDI6539118.1 hypothetical protein [Pantoea ananatis]